MTRVPATGQSGPWLFCAINLIRKNDWCCEWLDDLRRKHILQQFPCFYALQETDNWTTSAMNVHGYIAHGRDHGGPATFCPREVHHIRRSWADHKRCTANMWGSSMLLSVYVPSIDGTAKVQVFDSLESRFTFVFDLGWMPSTRLRSDHQLWTLCMWRLPALLSTSCRGQVPSIPQVHNRTWELAECAPQLRRNAWQENLTDIRFCHVQCTQLFDMLTDWIHSSLELFTRLQPRLLCCTHNVLRILQPCSDTSPPSCSSASLRRERSGLTSHDELEPPYWTGRTGFLAATSMATSALPLSSSGLARFRLIASSRRNRPFTCDVLEHFLLYLDPALVWMPLSGRPRCDGHAPRAPNRHTVLANFHTTSNVDSSRFPTGGGKTCSGGTSGAGRRIRAAGSARRRSQGSPLTASSNSMSHASISGTILIARAGCTPSGDPIA